MKMKHAILIALIGTVLSLIEKVIIVIKYVVILGSSVDNMRMVLGIFFLIGLLIFFSVLYSKQIKEDPKNINQSPVISPNSAEQQKSSSVFAEYMSFKRMISLTVVPIIYVLGIIAIVAISSALIYSGIVDEGAEHLVLEGFGLLTIGNILWRLTCEGWTSLIRMASLFFMKEKNYDRKV
ncbi:DUF4282 domain-containing protein [uncultured Sunxiuqinia sp.]|uniref:DUF4282 domain-containing protein n=1 Tax=uncultured Sunxiuqinia sp. TaxID=1573825 RepID=UPI002AA94FBE|nr:DUF4282 domain-containing protein [uncultured Sunxiuqinia sp.]